MKVLLYLGLLLVALLAVFTYPGTIGLSIIISRTPAPGFSTPGGTPSWLRVEHPVGGLPFIADDRGRTVLLHGAIPASLLDFGNNDNPDAPAVYPIDAAAYVNGQCPANSPLSRYPPLCQADIDSMAEMGFNSVRLPISWSLLEPERGQFSQRYLDRVAQVVEWARAAGLYLIIDMHQNAYSRYVGKGTGVYLSYNSGAPKWATFTDGFPSRVFGMREVNPAVFEAATNFWYDRAGIQDEYIAAIATIAARFKNESTVAGYSVFNEPWPGWNLPPGFDDLLLFPFYRRVIDAITGVRDGLPCWTGFFMPATCGYPDLGVHDLRHLIFLDTGLMREVTDFPTHLGLPFTTYPNVVLSMHAYTHIYTIDKLIGQAPATATYPWGGFDQSYALADREARALNTALFVAEFGGDPSEDSFEVTNQLREQEKHNLGLAFWTWKENGGATSWGMFNPPATATASSGCLRVARERLLARVYPRASADPSPTYRYDPSTGAFSFAGHGRLGDAPTLISIPPEVTGEVTSSGTVQASLTSAPDGNRLVTASPAGGPFSIEVAPAPLSLSGC